MRNMKMRQISMSFSARVLLVWWIRSWMDWSNASQSGAGLVCLLVLAPSCSVRIIGIRRID